MSQSEMANVFVTLEAIGSTTSRIEKEQILKAGDSDYLRTLLERTYNNFRVYGIKKVPKITRFPTDRDLVQNYYDFLYLLERLEQRLITGNVAIDEVTGFFQACSELEYKWYSKVLKKDLKIGITEKTVNKVFKGLVPIFTCMLAENIKPNSFPDIFVIQPKLDGYRCLAFKTYAGEVTLFSRNGKLIEGYDQIEEDIGLLPGGSIYDGEIMSLDGSFHGVQTSAFKKSKGKEGILNIFDRVAIEEFTGEKSVYPYGFRRSNLEDLRSIIKGTSSLRILESEGPFSNDKSDIEIVYDFHKKFLAKGYEGTMVKSLHAPYKKGKGRHIQKIKEMETLDLPVIGVEKGKEGTKYEGTLGALIVEYKGNPVHVGSGYSDAERDKFWNSRTDIINRIIEVQFFEETKDKNEKLSLRFPVFIKVRDDK
jgi:DNA ligase-1